jgi:hypothetical protein
MNPDIKAQWVAALRSGEYIQGKGYLRRRIGTTDSYAYCCLGVLTDLAIKAGVGSVSLYGSYLSVSVRLWAGLPTCNPLVNSRPDEVVLSIENDAGVPFSKIADLIEAYL